MISVFLCGDVMTGRGIDQILPHPGDPTLHEHCLRDARQYVELAERRSGPITQPVGLEYIWGDALGELEQAGTDVRIINLETSITASDDCWPDKEVLYRMHPRNIGCISAAGIHCCCLANNHVMDWGYKGLEDTLQTLDAAGVAHAGAGRNQAEAFAPAAIDVGEKGRVLVCGLGSGTSGIPQEWAAGAEQPGVNFLKDLSEDTARDVARRFLQAKRAGDVTVASIHWGGNWGYDVPVEEIRFAHRLIDEGIDMVHGHSSHHVKAFEVYRDRPIFYGCGDFVTDYEGIGGYEQFRGDISLMYLVTVDARDGRLVELRLIPMQTRRFRVTRASQADANWLCGLLNKLGKPFGTRVELQDDCRMTFGGG